MNKKLIAKLVAGIIMFAILILAIRAVDVNTQQPQQPTQPTNYNLAYTTSYISYLTTVTIINNSTVTLHSLIVQYYWNNPIFNDSTDEYTGNLTVTLTPNATTKIYLIGDPFGISIIGYQ